MEDIFKEMRELLFIQQESDILSTVGTTRCHSELEAARIAFEKNLSSVLDVGHIPFFLVRASVWRQRFNQIFASERILSLADATEKGEEGKLSPERERESYARAVEKMNEEQRQSDLQEKFGERVVDELLAAYKFPEYHDAAAELNRQLIVLAWNSFEVLVADTIRASLNSCPQLAGELFVQKEFKAYLSSSALFSALQSHNFDLSRKFGDFLVGETNFDSVLKIKAALNTLFPDPEVESELKSQDFHELYSKRNLIVHRRGVIDERFLASCACHQKVGDRLNASAESVARDLVFVSRLGANVLRSASVALQGN